MCSSDLIRIPVRRAQLVATGRRYHHKLPSTDLIRGRRRAAGPWKLRRPQFPAIVLVERPDPVVARTGAKHEAARRDDGPFQRPSGLVDHATTNERGGGAATARGGAGAAGWVTG